MSEDTFTSGPWEYSAGADGEYRIYAGVFPGASRAVFDVADVWLPDRGDRHANGRLIAAAPDLYASLGLALALIDNLRGAGDPDNAVRLTETGEKILEACRAAHSRVTDASARPPQAELGE